MVTTRRESCQLASRHRTVRQERIPNRLPTRGRSFPCRKAAAMVSSPGRHEVRQRLLDVPIACVILVEVPPSRPVRAH
jgi:hypothetical protein